MVPFLRHGVLEIDSPFRGIQKTSLCSQLVNNYEFYTPLLYNAVLLRIRRRNF